MRQDSLNCSYWVAASAELLTRLLRKLALQCHKVSRQQERYKTHELQCFLLGCSTIVLVYHRVIRNAAQTDRTSWPGVNEKESQAHLIGCSFATL